jgi:predicted alpha/beta-fold hydrolase
MMPFTPAMGMANPHIQTLAPRFIRKNAVLKGYAERLNTPDGDFLDLVWSEDNTQRQQSNKPIFVLFHGLEGSFESPYANGLMAAFAKHGWLSVMMHFRGCSGEVNRLARAYHSGETEDARHLLEQLSMRYPSNPIAVVGVSLGGNMMVNYLAKYVDDPIVSGCAVVSAPLDLACCSARIEHGFSQVYRNHLLGSLKQNALKKLHLLEEVLPITEHGIKAMKRLSEFDQQITAPLHGFRDAAHYYQVCSGLPKLAQVNAPLLVIHAKDDPFMTDAVIPNFTLPDNVNYRLFEHGGHVGFVSGRFTSPNLWLEEALPTHFNYLIT